MIMNEFSEDKLIGQTAVGNVVSNTCLNQTLFKTLYKRMLVFAPKIGLKWARNCLL